MENKKKPEKKTNKKKSEKKKAVKKKSEKKTNKKKSDKKESKGNGKVIIEKDQEGSVEDQNYSEKLNLIISRIKDKSMLVNENKIRFGWKW